MSYSSNIAEIRAWIAANHRPRQELPSHIRQVIIGLHAGGKTQHEIGRQLGLSRSTVQTTIRLARQRDCGQSRRRSGRPRLWDDRLVRRVLRYIKKEPKIKYRALRLGLGLRISMSTFHRILKLSRIRKWLSKKRPLLSKADAAKRLA